MKQTIKDMPVFGPIAKKLFRKWLYPPQPFSSSKNYWEERYESGGDSGNGSYRKLAEFKAEVLNEFVLANKVKTVIEFGSGDGNQLKLAEYPSYTGFDVSPTAVNLCTKMFSGDATKTFKTVNDFKNETAQLTLSLDVIYHLVEDNIFHDYMARLFNSSEKFVIIYSSNTNNNAEGQACHVRHRKFSEWIEAEKTEWSLLEHKKNRYPFDGNTKTGSFADFFIYQKA